MNPKHKKVLLALALAKRDFGDGFGYLGFSTLRAETGLTRAAIRRSCRFLKRKGLAQFGFGLWTENGEPAGSGYAATSAGVAECESWLESTARALYPESKFAQARPSISEDK